MNAMAKIADTAKTFPTIMRITQEIEIMHSLEELSINEIIEEKDVFRQILYRLSDSHCDNYVFEHDTKTVMGFTNFFKWLEKIKEIEEIKNNKNFVEEIDNIIDEMGVFFPKTSQWIEVGKVFTDEELDYICISTIAKQTFHGKEYYIMESWDNASIITDLNKFVCEIIYKQIACAENNYQYEYIITPTNSKLIDYLKNINK
jgi:hypothetical protein